MGLPLGILVFSHTYHIDSFLSVSDLSQCTLVCRDWQEKAGSALFQAIIEQVNKQGGQGCIFSPLSQAQYLSTETLCDIFYQNQLALLAIVARVKIPSFCLHGTPKEGILGIIKTRSACGPKFHLQAAQTSVIGNPIVLLADLYATVHKAYNYSNTNKGGGMFILKGEHAGRDLICECSKREEFLCFPSVEADRDSQRKFLRLIHRVDTNCGLASIQLSESNYSHKVLGVVTHTLYPIEDEPASRIPSKKQELMGTNPETCFLIVRIRLQEQLFKIFARLGVLKNISKVDLSCAAPMMERIKEASEISREQWRILERLPPLESAFNPHYREAPDID